MGRSAQAWRRAVILRAMRSGSHIIVLGAGIVGLFTALLLRDRGMAVTVFDPAAQAARQSSWAGGGIVTPLWPWDEPPAIQQWAQQAHHGYPEWAARLLVETGIDVEYRRTGIRWALTEAEQAAAEAWHQRWSLPFTRCADGLLSTELGQVRNPRLGRALAAAAQNAGIDLRLGVTAKPALREGRVVGVQTVGGQRLAADAVVVAAGAWSAELLASAGARSDVYPVKGQMLLYASQSAATVTGPIHISRLVYLIPRADGQIVAGSTLEHCGFDTTPSPQARQQLHAAALSLWPALSGCELIGQWAGLRPGSNDLPQAGPTEVPGLWAHCGHFRNGITLAPATATELVAQMLEAT